MVTLCAKHRRQILDGFGLDHVIPRRVGVTVIIPTLDIAQNGIQNRIVDQNYELVRLEPSTFGIHYGFSNAWIFSGMSNIEFCGHSSG